MPAQEYPEVLHDYSSHPVTGQCVICGGPTYRTGPNEGSVLANGKTVHKWPCVDGDDPRLANAD